MFFMFISRGLVKWRSTSGSNSGGTLPYPISHILAFCGNRYGTGGGGGGGPTVMIPQIGQIGAITDHVCFFYTDFTFSPGESARNSPGQKKLNWVSI